MGIIYKVTAPDGKVYVGQTIDSWKIVGDSTATRLSTSMRCSSGESIREHGPEAFTVEVVVEAPEEDLNELERAYIAEFDCLPQWAEPH